MTTDELSALILPWAKTAHPDKYAATLAVAPDPKTFRRYLVRLVEIRWAEDSAEWRGNVPLSVLEESSIRMDFKHRGTGETLKVGGKLAGRRDWAFAELAMLMENPDAAPTVIAAKQELELEVVSVGPATRDLRAVWLHKPKWMP